MRLMRLLKSDGTWNKMVEDWSRQCAENGDDFEQYALDAFPVLEPLTEKKDQRTWVVSVADDQSRHMAIAMANLVPSLKGYTGPVLRVRHVVACPLLDFGNLSKNSYAEALVGLLSGIIDLSHSDLQAQHIKFHLRSPGDMDYFQAFGISLDKERVFSSTEMKGAWLYIRK